MSAAQHTPGALRTWDNDKRCAECCNGDRCDDPTHYDRQHCPHCKGTGCAIWTEAGRADYVANMMKNRGMSEAEARVQLAKATGQEARSA